MKKIILLLILISTGCAYRLGRTERKIPGDYKQVSVPLFKNLTMEPGIETSFTNALIYEFERAQTAKPVPPELAEVEIMGEIRSLLVQGQGPSEGDPAPSGTVLFSSYRLVVEVSVQMRKASDKTVLKEWTFKDERTYTAPAVKQVGLNTVNPLYNQSARRQNLEELASVMMAEAHDRMTENF